MYMGSLGPTQMYGYLKPQEGQENACTPIYTLARKIYKVCNLTVFHSSKENQMGFQIYFWYKVEVFDM